MQTSVIGVLPVAYMVACAINTLYLVIVDYDYAENHSGCNDD